MRGFNMKYKVEITETIQRTVEVEAKDEGKAYQIVNDMYRNEKIVLSADDYIDTKIEVLSD